MFERYQSPRGQGRREVVPAVPQAMHREKNISQNYLITSKSKYSAWCIKMEVDMKAHGVWEAVESEEPVEIHKDMMALAVIYQGLRDETVLRLGVKRTAKEAWESLRTMHLGARRVKEVRAHGANLTSIPSKDVEDYIHQIPTEREGDIRPVNQTYLPNQEELSHNSTCYRNVTQEGVTEKKNRIKIFLNEEDMQLTSRRTGMEPKREQRLSNEVLRSNQDETSCKSTCFGSSIHHRFTVNWNHVKISCGLKVIQLLNQEMSGLPYLQAHGFNHLQTRFWRPGEAHNHSGGTYKHPGRSFIML